MDNIWTIAFLTSVLAAAVPAGTAILYAALGETFADLAGIPAKSRFQNIDIPLLSDIPRIGPILFQQSALVYISFIFVPFCWWYFYRTRQGLNLRAIGERPEAADAMGINVAALRYLYVIIGGALAGVGGAAISLGTNP